METPTPPISLDNLDKPVLRLGDSTYPSTDPDMINPTNGLPRDLRSLDTPAPTPEFLAAHGAALPVTPPETPLLHKDLGLHRQLLQNLLAKQGSSPPVSPLGTEQSIATMPTSAIDTEPTRLQSSSETVYPYDTASRGQYHHPPRWVLMPDTPASDSGSELDESDAVFSQPISPDTVSPSTPVSDLGDYFPVMSDSSGADSADQNLLFDSDSLKSLDTLHPESPYIKEIIQEEFADSAKPTMMMTPVTPDSSSDLDALDYGNPDIEPSNSPPPSHVLSPTQSGMYHFPIPAYTQKQIHSSCLRFRPMDQYRISLST